jgi:hypothetical protein
MEEGIRDIDRNRVFMNGVDEKYAELFAQGKPIHPYSLQCKVFSLYPVFKGVYALFLRVHTKV